MAVVTMDLVGVTSPSSTHVVRGGTVAAKPPASGLEPTYPSEFTTEDYSQATTLNGVYGTYTNGSTEDEYSAIVIKWKIPVAYGAVSNVSVSVSGYGDAGNYGDGNTGFVLYVKDTVNSVWTQVGETTTGGYYTPATVDGVITANAANYVSSSGIVTVMMITQRALDDSNNSATLNIDYTSCSVTHAGSESAAYWYYLQMMGAL